MNADAILMDDYKARRIAQDILQQHKKHIAVRGTLGIIVSAVKSGHLETSEAITLVTTLRERDDVWINPALCNQVIETLHKAK